MDDKCTGLVLRLRPLKDTSLIVHWLTPEYGRFATTAKGCRRAKSPFRGKLDLLFEANIAFRRSRHTDLHTLTEVNLPWLSRTSKMETTVDRAVSPSPEAPQPRPLDRLWMEPFRRTSEVTPGNEWTRRYRMRPTEYRSGDFLQFYK